MRKIRHATESVLFACFANEMREVLCDYKEISDNSSYIVEVDFLLYTICFVSRQISALAEEAE